MNIEQLTPITKRVTSNE